MWYDNDILKKYSKHMALFFFFFFGQTLIISLSSYSNIVM